MGTTAHVVVVGGDEPSLLTYARGRLLDLDRRWSRFRPDSELSRLNRRAGRPVVVSGETFRLVERSVAAWSATGGRFDPTVLAALVDAGYDRDFDDLTDGGRPARPPRPSPGCAGIRLDPGVPAVWLPAGTALDSGGIGKGLAADLLTEELLRRGAGGALVNVGGDLVARGTPPAGPRWVVSVDEPRTGAELARLAIAEGAVATSSPLRRRWRRGGVEAHHLIDPATGAPAAAVLAGVTVVAGAGWWAEALATAVCVGGPHAPLAARADASILTVARDGRVGGTPDMLELVA
jgi:FAD:protein FMN transferase